MRHIVITGQRQHSLHSDILLVLTEAGVGVNEKYRLKASEEWLVSGMTSGEVDSLGLGFTIVPVEVGVMKEVPEIVLENDDGETSCWE